MENERRVQQKAPASRYALLDELPWLFLFWAGYFLHGVVGRARMEPLRRSVCPALGWMGRHSLLLYLLHQPVIYGVLSAAAVLFA